MPRRCLFSETKHTNSSHMIVHIVAFLPRPDGIFADSATSDWTVSFHGAAALFAASEPVWRTACEGRFDARVPVPCAVLHGRVRAVR